MFALDELKEDCNSVLSKVYMLVVLCMCTIAGWGLIDSLVSIGMGTLLKMGFVNGCVFMVLVVIGVVDEKDTGTEVSLSDPLEEGDDGNGENDSDLTLSL